MAKLPRCTKCGAYNDQSEWPEEERENYDPNLCFQCKRQSIDETAEAPDEPTQESEAEEFDPDDNQVEGM